MLRMLLTTTSDGPSRPAVIQSAFRLVLTRELTKHVVSDGTNSVTNCILLERRFVSISEIDEREAVADEIDGCEQKLRYVQDQIAETQTAIVDMDRPDKSVLAVHCFPFALSESVGTTNGARILIISKDVLSTVELYHFKAYSFLNISTDETTDLGEIEGVIEHCSNLIEAKYLMQHLFNACIDHAVAAARADSQNKESEARIQQLEQQSFISEQLLSTVIADRDLSKYIVFCCHSYTVL
uniref:PID domain-containing protein n=1 Tax=Angiostrongylus cantonensis TaxID=6313 RepID=A0A158PC21_ANGCA